MELETESVKHLAPLIEKIGAVGTATIVALILIFKLLKQWLEYRATRAEAINAPSESDVETLLEIVADDEQEDAELIARVDSLTEELKELKRDLARLKQELGDE